MNLGSVKSVDEVEIVLTEEIWFEHILDGHPELNGYVDIILDAVYYPEFVCKGESGAKIAILNQGKNNWLHVVYREVNSKRGFIITAYLNNKYPKKKVIWLRHEQ